MPMPIAITQDNFEQEITHSKKPVVIDVYASWCGPCQHMMPIFAELEKELGEQYKFAKLNVDEARELSIKFGVTSVPTFIFIRNNEIKGKETGYMAKELLQEKIEEYLR
jgi:thioredoxin 1